jgi:hypothetical protein
VDTPGAHLLGESLVGSEKELLTRLPTGVEGPRNLRPAEGPIRQESTVLSCEGDSLSNGLVDDVD